MQKMKKTMFRVYFLTDYEAEEQWLHDMRAEGWELCSNPFPYCYQFEKTEPEETTYRLEFHPDHKDRDTYLAMAEDCGWSYLLGQNSWIYFWKKTGKDPSENEIFTDDASRRDMVAKTAKQRFVPALVLTLFLLAEEVFLILNQQDPEELIFITILVLVIAALDIHLIRGVSEDQQETCWLRKFIALLQNLQIFRIPVRVLRTAYFSSRRTFFL
ncbi:MAG: DUF2812 domain-containing protein [Bulleidia sp.]